MYCELRNRHPKCYMNSDCLLIKDLTMTLLDNYASEKFGTRESEIVKNEMSHKNIRNKPVWLKIIRWGTKAMVYVNGRGRLFQDSGEMSIPDPRNCGIHLGGFHEWRMVCGWKMPSLRQCNTLL